MATWSAASGGQLEVLRWLQGLHSPCPWSTDCSTVAIEGRNQDVLTCLPAQDLALPYDEGSIFMAAKKGDLATLAWLFK